MALKDLKTNLKSLRFGYDRPGGGDSGLPYIKTPLPDDATGIEKIALESARFSQDFPIRGGALSITNSATDLLRISRFLTDVPRGPLFITKQVGLQLSNPKIETGKQIGLENTRLYNLGVNTLAQVPSNAFGLHFDRSGLLPIINDQDKYAYIVSHKEKEKNRLVLLHQSKIIEEDLKQNYNFFPYELTDGTTSNFNSILDLQNELNRLTPNLPENVSSDLSDLGISSDRNMIFDYSGGPNSVLGIIGRTKVSRDTDTTNRASSKPEDKTRYITMNHLAYNKLSRDGLKTAFSPDFRKIANEEFIGSANDKFLPSSDYINQNMERRIGIGNPGKPFRDRRDYSVSDIDTQDRINMIPLFTEDIQGDSRVNINGTEYSTRDLIKFRFESINNLNPASNIKILFRAFLNNITDNYNSSWSPVKYVGRGENFYVYDNFYRQISFGFKVAAQSRDEMKVLYQKLNFLASNLAPDYTTTFMSGPLVTLTMGDYIYRQPGFINSLNLTIPDDSPWEIAINDPEGGNDKDMYELPHILNAQVQFVPIHNFIPRKGTKVPFITPGGKENKFLKDIEV